MKPTNRRVQEKSSGDLAQSLGSSTQGNSKGEGGSSGGYFVPGLARISGRYLSVIVALFSLITLFSLMDLVTSFVAYRQGLAEGNPMLLGSSQIMGLSVFNALAGTKLAFVVGMMAIALMGAWSRNSTVTKMTMAMLGSFAVVFAMVSLNNLVAIGVF
jgi:hypothetical protein